MQRSSPQMSATALPRSLAKRGRGLLFATLMLGQMSQTIAFTAFVAVLPQMAHDWGPRGPFLAQMTMALGSLGMMCGSFVSGWVLERTGTRACLIGALAAFGLSGAEGVVSTNATAMLIARFVNGLAAAVMATTCLWGITAEYKGAARAKVLGISAALSNLTAFGATLLGGYLAQVEGWPVAFAQFPVFGLIGLVLAFISIEQIYPSREHNGALACPFFRRLLPFFLLAMFLFSVRFMSSTQLPFVLDQNGIREAGRRAQLISAVTMSATASSFLYGALQQRLTALGTFAAGLACMAVALATVAVGVHFVSALIGTLLLGLSNGILGPYVYHTVSERSDAGSRSRAIGMVGAFCFLGGFVNPIIATPVANVVGLRNLFLLVALSMGITALAVGGASLRELLSSATDPKQRPREGPPN
jgi:MFS family permease